MKVTDGPAGKAKGKSKKAKEYPVILSQNHQENPVILSNGISSK